jgi:hypothetical protein
MKGVSQKASGEEAWINFDWEFHNWKKLTQHGSWVFRNRNRCPSRLWQTTLPVVRVELNKTCCPSQVLHSIRHVSGMQDMRAGQVQVLLRGKTADVPHSGLTSKIKYVKQRNILHSIKICPFVFEYNYTFYIRELRKWICHLLTSFCQLNSFNMLNYLDKCLYSNCQILIAMYLIHL